MQKTGLSTITALCLINIIFESISTSAMGVILPFIKEESQLTEALAGVVGGAMALGMLFTFAVGKLSDRFGRMSILRAGNLIIFLSTGLISFTHDLQLLIMLLIFGGVGVSFLESSINPLMAEAHSKRRGKVINILHGTWGIGAVTGPALATYILSVGQNWRTFYSIYSPTYLAVFIISFFISGKVLKNTRIPSKPMLQNKDLKAVDFKFLILFALTALFISSTYAGVGIWLPSFLMSSKNFSLDLAGITLSLFVGFIAIGRFVLAFLVDKFDYGLTMLVSSLLAAIFTLVALTMWFPAALIGFWCAVGFFLAPNLPTIIAKANATFPGYAGSVTGILFTSMAIGGFLSAWLIGILIQLYSLYVGMLFIVLASTMIAILQVAEKLMTSARMRIS